MQVIPRTKVKAVAHFFPMPNSIVHEVEEVDFVFNTNDPAQAVNILQAIAGWDGKKVHLWDNITITLDRGDGVS